MSHEEIYKLKINQLVTIKCNEPIDGYYIAKVKCINDWKKLIGVLDSNDQYKELPYRLILSCI